MQKDATGVRILALPAKGFVSIGLVSARVLGRSEPKISFFAPAMTRIGVSYRHGTETVPTGSDYEDFPANLSGIQVQTSWHAKCYCPVGKWRTPTITWNFDLGPDAGIGRPRLRPDG